MRDYKVFYDALALPASQVVLAAKGIKRDYNDESLDDLFGAIAALEERLMDPEIYKEPLVDNDSPSEKDSGEVKDTIA